MVSDQRECVDCLKRGNAFLPKHNRYVLLNLLKASDNDRQYLQLLEPKLPILDDILKRSRFQKDQDAVLQLCEDKAVDSESVQDTAVEQYESMHHAGEWRPDQKAVDRSKLPPKFTANYASNNSEASGKELIQISASDSSAGNKTKPGNCNHCGESGHWKRECPKLKSQKGGSNDKKVRFKKPVQNNGDKKEKHWTRVGPKDGEAQTKQANGKTYKWCKKCSRWNTSHSSDEHKKGAGKPRNSKPSGPQANTAGLGLEMVDNPAAWMAVKQPSSSQTTASDSTDSDISNFMAPKAWKKQYHKPTREKKQKKDNLKAQVTPTGPRKKQKYVSKKMTDKKDPKVVTMDHVYSSKCFNPLHQLNHLSKCDNPMHHLMQAELNELEGFKGTVSKDFKWMGGMIFEGADLLVSYLFFAWIVWTIAGAGVWLRTLDQPFIDASAAVAADTAYFLSGWLSFLWSSIGWMPHLK